MEEKPKTEAELLDLIRDKTLDKNLTLDLTNLNIPYVKIYDAKFNYVNFSNSTLPYLALDEVIMDNVNLSETTLTNSIISDCLFDVDVNLRGVNLTETRITNTAIFIGRNKYGLWGL